MFHLNKFRKNHRFIFIGKNTTNDGNTIVDLFFVIFDTYLLYYLYDQFYIL